MKRLWIALVLGLALGLPGASAAKHVYTKTSRCESITISVLLAGSGEGDVKAHVETLTNTEPTPTVEFFMERGTGTIRAVKITRPAAGGTVDVTSIPGPVLVEYAGCRPKSEGRGIAVEYYDAADFLP